VCPDPLAKLVIFQKMTQTLCCMWVALLVIPVAMSKTPTSSVDEECDAAKEEMLLQSHGRIKDAVVAGIEVSRGEGWSASPKPGQCLDIPGGSLHNNQKVSIWKCFAKSAPQSFQWWEDGTIRYAANTEWCVDIDSSQCTDGPNKGEWVCFGAGAKVQLWPCHGKINQQWEFVDTEKGLKASIKTKGQSLCIADKTGKYENAAQLTMEECTEDTKLEIPDLFGSQLRPLNVLGTEDQVCIDAAANSVKDGSRMLVWKCLKHKNGLLQGNQNFKYSKQDSTIRFTMYPNMCLDVKDEKIEDGQTVQVWSCTGKANQQWTLEDNQIKVKSNPKLCLGDGSKQFGKDTPMTLTACSKSQSFHFRGEGNMDCPWKKPNDEDWAPTCGDGSTKAGYYCVREGFGQRLQCAKQLPVMCAKTTCGGDKDFCCEPNEEHCLAHGHGGVRAC